MAGAGRGITDLRGRRGRAGGSVHAGGAEDKPGGPRSIGRGIGNRIKTEPVKAGNGVLDGINVGATVAVLLATYS